MADRQTARVEIVGDHPHAGCIGLLHSDARGISVLNGPLMWQVELTHCCHGTRACFARIDQLKKTAHQPGSGL